jgi:hypothetical protein
MKRITAPNSIMAVARRVAVSLIASLLGIGCLAVPTLAQHTYYFYNSVGDSYNNLCEGYIWQEMGFVDANGVPATEQGDKLLLAGQQVGTVTQREKGSKLASVYESFPVADKTAEDLHRQGVTITNVFANAGAQDRLFVCGHGAPHTHRTGVTHPGGLIQLDKNTAGVSKFGFFAGFMNPPVTEDGGTLINTKQGKNQAKESFGLPYPVDAPPAKFGGQAKLYTCLGGNDPDGDGKELSVAQSLKNAGVPTVNSPNQITFARVEVTASNNKGKKALQQWAAAIQLNGKDGVETRLAMVPFLREYATGQAVLKGTDATLKLVYREPDPANGPAFGRAGCASACTEAACAVDFSNLGFGSLTIPATSLPGEEATIIDPAQLDPADLPPGPGPLAGPAVSLMGIDQAPVQLLNSQKASLTLPFYGSPGCNPKVYRLDDGTWIAVDNNLTDNSTPETVMVSIDQLTIYGVFGNGTCEMDDQ